MTGYDLSKMKTERIYRNLQDNIKMIGSKAPIEAKKHAVLWASRYMVELQSRIERNDPSAISFLDRDAS